MSKEYDVLLETALRLGWCTPGNEFFGEKPWIDYWNAMIDLGAKVKEYWNTHTRGVDPPPDFGRPVPPHRSG